MSSTDPSVVGSKKLGGYVFTVSGYAFCEREEIRRLVEQHGGIYMGNMRRDMCTHLVIDNRCGEKFVCAQEWGIHIVTKEWLIHATLSGADSRARDPSPEGSTLRCDTQQEKLQQTTAYRERSPDDWSRGPLALNHSSREAATLLDRSPDVWHSSRGPPNDNSRATPHVVKNHFEQSPEIWHSSCGPPRGRSPEARNSYNSRLDRASKALHVSHSDGSQRETTAVRGKAVQTTVSRERSPDLWHSSRGPLSGSRPGRDYHPLGPSGGTGSLNYKAPRRCLKRKPEERENSPLSPRFEKARRALCSPSLRREQEDAAREIFEKAHSTSGLDPSARDKATRAKMHGYDCPCCAGYYNSLGLTPEERQQRVNQVSRHRGFQPMPRTPPRYWDVHFPSEDEQRALGLMKEVYDPHLASLLRQ